MWNYEYDWNDRDSRAEKFGCNHPVSESTELYDLLTGQIRTVSAMVPAALPDIPRPIISTQLIGVLDEERLRKLRNRCGYEPDYTKVPLDDIAFFTSEAQRIEVFG